MTLEVVLTQAYIITESLGNPIWMYITDFGASNFGSSAVLVFA